MSACRKASATTFRRATAVHPVAALQIEYSLLSRSIEPEILPTARALGITVLAYGVPSRGLISDSAQASQQSGDVRSRMPRFSAENFSRNLALVEAMAAIARDKNVATAQLAFAWVRFRGDDIAPLIGARRRVQLYEALGALDIVPSPEDLAHIEQAMSAHAVPGTRYMPPVLAHLDSECAR
jgi:aryl-alcohol dehydrogenase-like predicted oxidoreductase